MILTNRLVELRNKYNLSQEDVAAFLKVGRTTYGMYERCDREMDYVTLVKLADFFKVSLDYLFGRTQMPIHLESYSSDEIEFMTRCLALYKEMKSKIN